MMTRDQEDLMRSKQNFKIILAIAAALPFCLGLTKIDSIEFKKNNEGHVIEIKSNEKISYTVENKKADNQIVINLSDVELSSFASRPLDTSSFESDVLLISPYNVEKEPGNAKIVVQLRKAIETEILNEENSLKIKIKETATNSNAGESNEVESEIAQNESEPNGSDTSISSNAAPETEGTKNLKNFIGNREKNNFSGSPINLQVREADIRDVLRLISEASGFNIIIDENVRGNISLSLYNVPWDQALDVVLSTKKLGAERNNNILRVMTLDDLRKEKESTLRNKALAEASSPKVTRVFSISYADVKELAKIVKAFGKGGVDLSSVGGGAQAQANVEVDERTNSIIVQDTQENLARVQKLIEILDTQTPQVLVESKIVEASEDFQLDIGGQIGFLQKTSSVSNLLSFNGSSPSALVSTTDELPSSFSSTGGGTFSLGFISAGIASLNAAINIAQNENKAKIVSSPKTVVLNRQKASIKHSTPRLREIQTVTQNGAALGKSFEELDAMVSLEVEPTVTNDENVLMDLNVSSDVPKDFTSQSAIAERNLKTKVIVESGSTLVIGGIFTETKNNVDSGFPILKDIPILGVLFGSKTKKSEKSELLIFITPKILNLKSAGLSTPST